ncbi:hypothetical protein OHC33_007378 [Knufia fluminis]|uniref:Ubiquitin-like-conjugating enzyme ATG10 n=1 Tax=Knufia fluminis TaxID=191047 RepID=A0AAN8EBS4_9EURO|nr:hypothetical protein OHC33_007378 [Knufia fluminis]
MVVAYPSLTRDEFFQAGEELTRLCEEKLTGSSWLNMKWTGHELQIQQRRNETPATSNREDTDSDPDELVQDDSETFDRACNYPTSSITIDFSIVLSPTYQVPVLWFSFSSQAPTSATALDQVYAVIVSPTSRDGLRQIGVLGGISIANHPISDMPAFFIHPCRTQEALETVRPDNEISPLQYLLLWFGIIGSAVGLSVPADVFTSA